MFYVVCLLYKYYVKCCFEILGIYDEMVVEGLIFEEDIYKLWFEWESCILFGVYLMFKDWVDKLVERMKEVFMI